MLKVCNNQLVPYIICKSVSIFYVIVDLLYRLAKMLQVSEKYAAILGVGVNKST